MIELLLIVQAYMLKLVEWLRTHLSRRKRVSYLSRTKYFKKGDFVVTEDGATGRVWRVYIKIKTGKPVGCSVIWDHPYKGEKVTAFIPAEDKTPRFNPVIRRA